MSRKIAQIRAKGKGDAGCARLPPGNISLTANGISLYKAAMSLNDTSRWPRSQPGSGMASGVRSRREAWHRMRHPGLLALLAALPLLLLPFIAGDCRADARQRVVMFIPDTDWPPYAISDPDHPRGGVLQAVFRAVAEPMGCEVEVRRLPDKRGWLQLEQGEVDVHAKAMEWVRNPDDYLWTDPFMPSETAFLYLDDCDMVSAQPTDLYGRSVAAIRGFIYPELEEHFGQGRIERVDVTSPFTMLELLELGRVDAALVNGAETRWLMRTDPRLAGFRLDPRPCGLALYRFVFTRDDKWKPFIKEFNRRLKQMREDGSLDALLDEYR